MELNRLELYKFMDYIADGIRSKSQEEQNTLLLNKIESVFNYLNERNNFVPTSNDQLHLTQRQVTTLLNSIRESDNNNFLNSYFEIVDFVYSNGQFSTQNLSRIEVEILQFQLSRISKKLKN